MDWVKNYGKKVLAKKRHDSHKKSESNKKVTRKGSNGHKVHKKKVSFSRRVSRH